MTAYNAHNKLARAQKGGRQIVLDPGDAGTIVAKQVFPAVCVVTGGTTRSLEAASRYGVGDSILIISQTSTITVNSVALADGEHAEFVVTLDSAGAEQWVTKSAGDVLAYLERAKLVAIPLETFRVHDNYTANLPSVAADDDDLELLSPTIGTTAPAITATVSNASVTKEAIVAAVVPSDYVAGQPISIVIPWTRADAATTSATLDLTAYRAAAPTVDINSTAAVDINAAASGTATFVLTPTDVVPGEQILLNLLVAVVDGTTSLQSLLSVNWSYTASIA